MKKVLIFIGLVSATLFALAQNEKTSFYNNSSSSLIEKESNLTIGGYGEVHFNQPLNNSEKKIGKLDVHRIVMLLGYNFSEKTQFVSELEFEHVSEVYVEQAFLQHKINKYINLRGGLMLIPMGIVNEYHEPTTFNGVERTLVDKYITPTTWREIGFGITGNILPASLKYQAYLVNGFNGYNGSAKLSGKNGYRKGRQKGAESYVSSPNFTSKLEYYGFRSLNIGLSGYFGNTQSTLYDGVSKEDASAMAKADSTIVGIAMLGLDARYNYKGFEARAQLYWANNNNTDQYNAFTGSDIGSQMLGYYFEVGYNVLRSIESDYNLTPFVRYEYYNTQEQLASNTALNLDYKNQAITSGLTLDLTNGAVFKVDLQWSKNALTDTYSSVFNAGFGIMF